MVVHHFRESMYALLPSSRVLEPILGTGWLGVEVFFVLSGFVLAQNYADRLSTGHRGTVYRFWWARMARVYPVHLATLGAMVALASFAGVDGPRYSLWNIVGNLFMLQAVPGFRGVVWPSWSVSCEVAAYLLFPLLVSWSSRLIPRRALVIGACLLLALPSVVLALSWWSGGFWSMSYLVIWLRIGLEFPTGVLLWVWWRSRVARSRRWDVVGGAAAVGVATIAIVTDLDEDSPWTLLAAPAIGVFVLACASAAGPLAAWLGSRVMQWGGRISYSLYMTHFLVLLVAQRAAAVFADSSVWTRIAVVVLLAASVVGAAAVCHRLVEEPARLRLRRRAVETPPPGGSVRAPARARRKDSSIQPAG